MGENYRESATPQPQDKDLEFKPMVKYIALGLLGATLLGVEYATYRFGVEQGRIEAIASGHVAEAINTAAVENLAHFMQIATADDATLTEAVRNRAVVLNWIKDKTVLREAEWALSQALIDRSKGHEGTELLAELIQQAPPTRVWARRSHIAARAMADEGYKDAALAYYRCAADRYESLQARSEQLETLSEMVELLASASAGDEGLLSSLDALQQKVATLGEEGLELRANILAYMGRLYRVHGNHTEALKYFEQALSGVDPDKTPVLASAAVCFGSALLEKGDTHRAAELLRDGIKRLGENPADTPFLVTALRDLARIEEAEGNTDTALALLYRAEGAATGRISDNSLFWVCLYDQRGWVNYTRKACKIALADFQKALESHKMQDELRAQPLEGAGRCCITLGMGADAIKHLEECVLLRERFYPNDTATMGRTHLLLAQAHDLTGDSAKAAEAYHIAIDKLPQEGNDDRLYAMLGYAYALAQLKQWEAATEAWNALIPLVKGDEPLSKEVYAQLQLSKHHTPQTTAAESAEAAAHSAPAPPSRSTRRRR